LLNLLQSLGDGGKIIGDGRHAQPP
jgi:hypothetical protein